MADHSASTSSCVGSGREAKGVIAASGAADGAGGRAPFACPESRVRAREAIPASSSVGTTASTMPFSTRFSATWTPSGKGSPCTVS